MTKKAHEPTAEKVEKSNANPDNKAVKYKNIWHTKLNINGVIYPINAEFESDKDLSRLISLKMIKKV